MNGPPASSSRPRTAPAWAGVTGSGGVTLVVGLGASTILGLLARPLVAIDRALPANR